MTMLGSRRSLTGGLASALIVLAGSAASLAASSNAPSSHLDSPADLRCDGLREPLALADASPMFSWELQASSEGLHAVSQSAYRIQVADSGGQPRNILWDSGVVHAGATADIAYAGPALIAQHAYVWRVRVWDEQGHAGA
jgi:alpha-L-rhamnosidase